MAEKDITKDILTIPNALSTAGLLLSIDGARHIDKPRGVVEVMSGRTLDLLDGVAARALDQSSDLGAGIDAAFDKLSMLAIFAQAWRHEAIPRPAISAMIAQNAFNSSASIVHKIRKPETQIRPTKVGKVGMAAENAAVFSYLLAHSLESSGRTPHLRAGLKLAGHAFTAIGLGLGLAAGIQYAKRLRES